MPEPISLDPLVFRELQVALLQQRLAQYQATEAMTTANNAVLQAMARAALDPDQRYRLDPITCSVIPESRPDPPSQ